MKKGKSLPPLFGGHPLEYWNTKWERLDGGFGVEHAKVYARTGLYRAVLGNETMFVGCSEELNRRLQQLRSEKELKTNRHYGAHMIRKHIRDVDLDVVLLEGPERKFYVARLKFAMIRHWDPVWNMGRPFNRKGGK